MVIELGSCVFADRYRVTLKTAGYALPTTTPNLARYG